MALIGYFSPLWEKYKKNFKKQIDFDPIELSKYGEALNLIKARKESLLSYLSKIGVTPSDVGDFNLKQIQRDLLCLPE